MNTKFLANLVLFELLTVKITYHSLAAPVRFRVLSLRTTTLAADARHASTTTYRD